MKFLKDKLKDILLRGRKISAADLEKALSDQKRTNQSLRRILIDNNFISEQDLMMLLS